MAMGTETAEQRNKRWGDTVRAERERIGQNRRQLALRAQIDYAQLWRFENGEGGLGADKKIQLAIALGRRVDDLFAIEPDTTS